MEIRKNDEFELTIEDMSEDGAGIGKQDGYIWFVKDAVIGDRIRARAMKMKKNYGFARLMEVLEASKDRVMPECPVARQCGGCQLQMMSYEAQLHFKERKVYNNLRRIGGMENLRLPERADEVSVPENVSERNTSERMETTDAGVKAENVSGKSAGEGVDKTITMDPILRMEHPWRYRNKAQFPVAKGPRIGFYRPRSHDVIDVDDCLLQGEAAARLRGAVKEWMAEYSIPAYNERTFTGLVRHVYVRTNRAGRSLCCLLVNGRGVPREVELVRALRRAEPNLAGIVLGVNEKHNNVILGDSYRTLWGEDFLSDTLCGLTFRLSVPSFYQVNPAQTEVLYGKALEFAGLTAAETVLDLYCGIGTISLVMARKAGMVWGAEVVPQAVDDAIANARRNHIENARFLCADAGEAARYLEGEGVRPDVVCVDPPRKGLAEDVVDTIADMGPERVVYVSCDPGTLGRDVKRFAGRGYTLKKAVAVDMFPRTAHVETVARLERS
mgnify:CR=1 FL=1